MAVAAQIVTPTAVQLDSGRIGICIYDNPNVTDVTHRSAYVIYADGSYTQERRSQLTPLSGVPTGVPGAWSSAILPDGSGPGA
jgi:hypothetical protein